MRSRGISIPSDMGDAFPTTPPGRRRAFRGQCRLLSVGQASPCRPCSVRQCFERRALGVKQACLAQPCLQAHHIPTADAAWWLARDFECSNHGKGSADSMAAGQHCCM